MRLTTHFALEEFGCRSGEPVPDEYIGNVTRLCDQLERVRAALGRRPIRILSGYRSPAWNMGRGAAKSQHLTANAADLRIHGISPSELYGAIERGIKRGDLKDGGVGLYLSRPGRKEGWVHLDGGPAGRRWRG